AIAGNATGAEYAEGFFEDISTHDPAAFIYECLRRECTQMRIELAVVCRRQRAGHCQDEWHAIDDPAGAVESIAVDSLGTSCVPGFESNCLVEHHQFRGPAAQLIAVGDDHCRVCDQHRVDVDGDDVGSMSQHECPVALIDELLLKLSQC